MQGPAQIHIELQNTQTRSRSRSRSCMSLAHLAFLLYRIALPRLSSPSATAGPAPPRKSHSLQTCQGHELTLRRYAALALADNFGPSRLSLRSGFVSALTLSIRGCLVVRFLMHSVDPLPWFGICRLSSSSSSHSNLHPDHHLHPHPFLLDSPLPAPLSSQLCCYLDRSRSF